MATYRGRKLTPIENTALEVLVKTIAPNPEDYKVDEAVHPMDVHVKEVPGKKVEGLPAFKVTKVGSKVKEHGGIKVGEHIHDNHIDDLADMGHKIKTEDVEQVDEIDLTHSDPAKHAKSKKYHYDLGKKTAMAGKEKGETSDSYGPYASDYEAGYHSVGPNKFKPIKKEENEMDENKQQKTLADYVADHITHQVDRQTGRDTEQVKDDQIDETMHKKKKKHDCASKVKSEQYGIGHCIPEQHTMLEDGTVTHYDVLFDHGLVENVPVTELEILQESMHEHYDNEEKNAQIDEAGHEMDGVPIQKIPENPKHTAKMRKAAKMFKSIPAAQRGTGSGGKRGGDSGFKTVKVGEETEQVDETIEFHNEYEIQIAEEYTYEDFVKAAIEVTDGSDDAVAIAEDHFNRNDISIIIEQFTRGDIQDKISAHKKAGSSVTMPKYTTKDDKMHAEYTVTDKKGMRRRHIHHGNISKVENMGKVNVSPDEKE